MGLRGVGVFLPTFAEKHGRTGGELAEFARRAEDLGFDSVWATDCPVSRHRSQVSRVIVHTFGAWAW